VLRMAAGYCFARYMTAADVSEEVCCILVESSASVVVLVLAMVVWDNES